MEVLRSKKIISVVMPTYNAEMYVAEAIESLDEIRVVTEKTSTSDDCKIKTANYFYLQWQQSEFAGKLGYYKQVHIESVMLFYECFNKN